MKFKEYVETSRELLHDKEMVEYQKDIEEKLSNHDVHVGFSVNGCEIEVWSYEPLTYALIDEFKLATGGLKFQRAYVNEDNNMVVELL